MNPSILVYWSFVQTAFKACYISPTLPNMHTSRLFSPTLCVFFSLSTIADAQGTTAQQGADGLGSGTLPSMTTPLASTGVSGTPTSYREIFTVPSAADAGASLLPNIQDPEAVDAQAVCPGYKAENVKKNDLGFTATLRLAGQACNVYGNDIDTLNLSVEYQSVDRLAVRIIPAAIDVSHRSWYLLPDQIVHQPTADEDAKSASLENDLTLTWSNDPVFSFTVFRKSTGDAVFDTRGTKLIFEDQYVEFASTLPPNYNLYGLGESMHGLRLGNNYTKTMWAVDIADPIDL